MSEKMPTTHAWFANWSSNRSSRTALRLLADIGGTDKHHTITRHRIVSACFNASHYDPKQDPGQIYRDALRVERKRLDQLVKAARTLGLCAGRNEKAMMWACAIAEEKSGARITRAIKDGPAPLNQVVEAYFIALADALKGKLPELHGGPFLKRHKVGNLVYADAISAGKPISVETMLGFELAFYLRMHTAGHAEDSPQNGQSMPTYGDPCYQVVAAFCSAAIGTAFDAKQIGDKVRKLRHVGLTDWPKGD